MPFFALPLIAHPAPGSVVRTYRQKSGVLKHAVIKFIIYILPVSLISIDYTTHIRTVVKVKVCFVHNCLFEVVLL